ncbi:MAG: restriction endonuclease subunit S [Actinomycetota bacterium]
MLRLEVDEVKVEAASAYELAGVYSFGRGLLRREAIPGTETSYRHLTRLHEGMVVVSRLKAFEGAVAVVSPEFDGLFVSQEFPTFTPALHRIDPQYLALMCQWPEFWERLSSLSRGVGARRERVHAEEILELFVPLPDLSEQRRTATRLTRLRTWIGSIRDCGVDVATAASALLAVARRRALGQLAAEGTRTEPLENVAQVAMGQSPPGYAYNFDGVGTPLLNGPTEFGEVHPTPRQWTTLVTQEAEPGDLLLSVRASIGRMNWADQAYCLGRGLAGIRARGELVAPGYLAHALSFMTARLSEMSAGSTFLNLPGTKLRKLMVPVPSVHRQNEIATHLDKVSRLTRATIMARYHATGITNALEASAMNAAFSGDL